MFRATIAVLTLASSLAAAPSPEGVPTLLESAIDLNNARAERLRAELALAESTCQALAWLVREGAVAEQALRDGKHELHRLTLVAAAVDQHARTLEQLRANCRPTAGQAGPETLVIWLRPPEGHDPAVAIHATWDHDPQVALQRDQLARRVADATGEADVFRAESRFLQAYVERLAKAGSTQFAEEIARKSMLLQISTARVALALAKADYFGQTERTHAPDNQTIWPLRIGGQTIASAAALAAYIDRDWHDALRPDRFAQDQRARDPLATQYLQAEQESRDARHRIAQLRLIADQDSVAEVQASRSELRLAVSEARLLVLEQRRALRQHLGLLQQPLISSGGELSSVVAYFQAAAAQTGSRQLAAAQVREFAADAAALEALYLEETVSWAEWRWAQRDLEIAQARLKQAVEQLEIAQLKFEWVSHLARRHAQATRFHLVGIVADAP